MHKRTDGESDVAAGDTGALQAALAALTASGADSIDPVRFRYIESLAARCEQSDFRITQFLLQKAWTALQLYQAGVDIRQSHSTPQPEPVYPQPTRSALAVLIEQLDAGEIDIGGDQEADTLASNASRQTAEEVDSELFQAAQNKYNTQLSGGLRELRAAQFFRDTLQQQRADTLLSRATRDAPEDSGPLNPQKLALRSLTLMHELSPAYLGHFVSYVDTLLWLEQIDHSQPDFNLAKRKAKANRKS